VRRGLRCATGPRGVGQRAPAATSGSGSRYLVVQRGGGQEALALGPLSAALLLLLVGHQPSRLQLVHVKLGGEPQRELHVGGVHAGGGRLHAQPVLGAGPQLEQRSEQRVLAAPQLLQRGQALLLYEGPHADPRIHPEGRALAAICKFFFRIFGLSYDGRCVRRSDDRGPPRGRRAPAAGSRAGRLINSGIGILKRTYFSAGTDTP
jgi:hypothetical protein